MKVGFEPEKAPRLSFSAVERWVRKEVLGVSMIRIDPQRKEEFVKRIYAAQTEEEKDKVCEEWRQYLHAIFKGN